MIGLIMLVIAIVILLAVAPFVLDEKGYVLIAFNNTTVEGTLVSFCILIVVSAIIIYLAYKLTRYLLSIYRNTKHSFFARSQERKNIAIEQALWSSINDDFEHVALALSGNAVPEHFQDIRLALLAKTAIVNNQTDKALEYLFDITPENQLKVAKLWLASGDTSAIESQMRIIAESKKATALELKLYTEVLVQQQKFSILEDFLPTLLHKKILNAQQWDVVFIAYMNALPNDKLASKYKALPKKLQTYAHNAYLIKMIQIGKFDDVEDDLTKMLKHKEQYAQLASILSKAVNINVVITATKLKNHIQDHLKKDENNQHLLISLACIANAQNDYNLAARIFDKVLNTDNKKQYAQQAILSYSKSEQADKALMLYQ